MLLRLDAGNGVPIDLVEAATLYILSSGDALAAKDFTRCEAYFGATI